MSRINKCSNPDLSQALLEKLEKIEALITKTSSEGEREAALAAKERLLQKKQQIPVEFMVSHQDLWKKRLFMTVCQKYGFSTYRYKRQKRTTSMVQVTPFVMDECIWPEYKKYVTLFEEFVNGILNDLLSQIEQNKHLAEDIILSDGQKIAKNEFVNLLN